LLIEKYVQDTVWERDAYAHKTKNTDYIVDRKHIIRIIRNTHKVEWAACGDYMVDYEDGTD
jgi:hypothetical protein